jgi:hypothetical protein
MVLPGFQKYKQKGRPVEIIYQSGMLGQEVHPEKGCATIPGGKAWPGFTFVSASHFYASGLYVRPQDSLGLLPSAASHPRD